MNSPVVKSFNYHIIPEGFAFTISRKEWLCRTGGADSYLLTRRDGLRQQCCVGICLTALGIKDMMLRGERTALGIEVLSAKAAELNSRITQYHAHRAAAVSHNVRHKQGYDVYDINDNIKHAEFPDSDHEALIIEAFGWMGMTVTIVD